MNVLICGKIVLIYVVFMLKILGFTLINDTKIKCYMQVRFAYN